MSWLPHGPTWIESEARSATGRGDFDEAHRLAEQIEPEHERIRVKAWIEATRERMLPPRPREDTVFGKPGLASVKARPRKR